MKHEPKVKRIDVQYLRALAVCLVLVFHVRKSFFPNGYLGVDIFFIISGFVLAPQLSQMYSSAFLEQTRKMLVFLSKRVKRLIPAFTVCVILSSVLLHIFSSISQLKPALGQALWSFLFLGNLGAGSLSGNYFNPNPNPFLHLWSLSAEWQVYLFFPLVFLGLSLLFKRKIDLNLTLIFLIALSLQFALFQSEENPLFSYYSPFTRVWQFAFGFLVFLRLNNWSPTKLLTNLFRIILLLSIVVLASQLQLSEIQASLIVVLTFTSAVFSNLQKLGAIGFCLEWIGNRSYSIYLFHLPLIYIAVYSPNSGDEPFLRLMGVVIAVLLTFICANLSYRYLEDGAIKRFTPRSFKIGWVYTWAFSLIGVFFLASLQLGVFQNTEKTSVSWRTNNQCTDGEQFNCVVFDADSQRAKVYVIGDSHAQHYFSSMRDFGKSQKIDFVYSTILNAQELKKSDPSLILYSKYRSQVDKNDLVSFKQDVSLLGDQKVPTIYIADNPVFTDYLKYTHYMNPSIFSLVQEHLGILKPPIYEVEVSELDRMSLLAREKYTAMSSELTFQIDPFKYLCSPNSCARFASGEWLYWDNHHLSEKGAKIVFEEIETTVLNLLKMKRL